MPLSNLRCVLFAIGIAHAHALTIGCCLLSTLSCYTSALRGLTFLNKLVSQSCCCAQSRLGGLPTVKGIAMTGSSDKTCRVFDLPSGNCRCTLLGHTEWISGMVRARSRRWQKGHVGSLGGLARVATFSYAHAVLQTGCLWTAGLHAA